MSGVSALAEGSSALLAGSDELGSGVSELYNGVAELASGAQSMASGASALNSETNSLDVQAEIDSLLADIGGSMEAPESFADGRNGTVTAVQFVIQTEAIEVPADDAGPEPAAEEAELLGQTPGPVRALRPDKPAACSSPFTNRRGYHKIAGRGVML